MLFREVFSISSLLKKFANLFGRRDGSIEERVSGPPGKAVSGSEALGPPTVTEATAPSVTPPPSLPVTNQDYIVPEMLQQVRLNQQEVGVSVGIQAAKISSVAAGGPFTRQEEWGKGKTATLPDIVKFLIEKSLLTPEKFQTLLAAAEQRLSAQEQKEQIRAYTPDYQRMEPLKDVELTFGQARAIFGDYAFWVKGVAEQIRPVIIERAMKKASLEAIVNAAVSAGFLTDERFDRLLAQAEQNQKVPPRQTLRSTYGPAYKPDYSMLAGLENVVLTVVQVSAAIGSDNPTGLSYSLSERGLFSQNYGVATAPLAAIVSSAEKYRLLDAAKLERLVMQARQNKKDSEYLSGQAQRFIDTLAAPGEFLADYRFMLELLGMFGIKSDGLSRLKEGNPRIFTQNGVTYAGLATFCAELAQMPGRGLAERDEILTGVFARIKAYEGELQSKEASAPLEEVPAEVLQQHERPFWLPQPTAKPGAIRQIPELPGGISYYQHALNQVAEGILQSPDGGQLLVYHPRSSDFARQLEGAKAGKMGATVYHPLLRKFGTLWDVTRGAEGKITGIQILFQGLAKPVSYAFNSALGGESELEARIWGSGSAAPTGN